MLGQSLRAFLEELSGMPYASSAIVMSVQFVSVLFICPFVHKGNILYPSMIFQIWNSSLDRNLKVESILIGYAFPKIWLWN